MELEEIRHRIDETDERLLAAFLERMALSAEVAECKAHSGGEILNPERERQILDKIRSRSGALAQYAARLYSEIMSISRDYQSELLSARANSQNGSGEGNAE